MNLSWERNVNNYLWAAKPFYTITVMSGFSLVVWELGKREVWEILLPSNMMLKALSPNQTRGTTVVWGVSTETNGANAHWASLTWKSQSDLPTGTDQFSWRFWERHECLWTHHINGVRVFQGMQMSWLWLKVGEREEFKAKITFFLTYWSAQRCLLFWELKNRGQDGSLTAYTSILKRIPLEEDN